MVSIDARRTEDFREVMAARARAVEIPEAADLYGWLIGGWEMDVAVYRGIDVTARGLKIEAYFGWVLDGLAVQDIWIMPTRAQRAGGFDKDFSFYGTTLRMWDAAIQAWRITWRDPTTSLREDQIGRRHGLDIVQIGSRPDGTVTRWSFSEITSDARAFRWTGEALNADGRTWRMEGDFRARRLSGA
jgi:hypothetical protein